MQKARSPVVAWERALLFFLGVDYAATVSLSISSRYTTRLLTTAL
jgi:hypothetical protein